MRKLSIKSTRQKLTKKNEQKKLKSFLAKAYSLSGDEVEKFYKKWSPMYHKGMKTANDLLDNTTECLIGHCDESSLKLIADGQKTMKAIADFKAPDSIKKRSERELHELEGTIKIVEKFSKKIQAGNRFFKIQKELKNEKQKVFTLALGLGLGLGLGLPLVFAVVLFVLFKSGRLSWVTPLESKA